MSVPRNRSVPADVLLPHLTYRDVGAALGWLRRAFGVREHYRYGDVEGAQARLGQAWFMLQRAGPGRATPAELGAATQSLTVFVDDVGAHYERARAAGATILEEPHETAYGEFQYAAADPDGHRWLFSQHARDVAPADWGAVVNEDAG